MGDESDDDYLPSPSPGVFEPVGVSFCNDIEIRPLSKHGKFLALVAGFANLKTIDLVNDTEFTASVLLQDSPQKTVKLSVFRREHEDDGDATMGYTEDSAADAATKKVELLNLPDFKVDMFRVLRDKASAALEYAFQRVEDNNALPPSFTRENYVEKFVASEEWRTPFAKLVALQLADSKYSFPGRYLTNEHYRVIQRQERAILARFKRNRRIWAADKVLNDVFY